MFNDSRNGFRGGSMILEAINDSQSCSMIPEVVQWFLKWFWKKFMKRFWKQSLKWFNDPQSDSGNDSRSDSRNDSRSGSRNDSRSWSIILEAVDGYWSSWIWIRQHQEWTMPWVLKRNNIKCHQQVTSIINWCCQSSRLHLGVMSYLMLEVEC